MSSNEYTLTTPEDGFTIRHRPERIHHDKYFVTDDNGDVVTGEDGEPVMAGGGTTIEGYTRFDLTVHEYDRDAVGAVLKDVGAWGPYVMSWWEDYNALMFDEEEMCPFEVRVLPDRVAVDVKASTTSESIEQFVERLTERVGGNWTVERSGERLAP